MKRRMVFYICTLILVCMFFRTIPAAAKENMGDINIGNMSEALPENKKYQNRYAVQSLPLENVEKIRHGNWILRAH